jgi:hypothetical protein
MKRLSIVIMIVSLLTACATVEKTPEQGPSSGDIILDEKLVETAKRIPRFGGMYFDDDGNLNVYLVEDVQRLRSEDVKAKRVQIEGVLADVLGKEFLTQRGVPRSEQEAKQQLKQPPVIKIVEGKYNIMELVKWRSGVDRALEVSGVVFTDLDERNNRLKVGIESAVSREQIEALLKKHGVPLKAVTIEVTKPIKLHATLRSKIRSMPGGVQIEADTGVWSNSKCTMGFNAIRSNVNGFVTNSHCTATQGGSDGTDFHQPDDPWWTEGNKVGDEIADPQYFTGGNCPSGRRCRYSDSAFIDYTVRRGMDIARTTGWNNGSLTISSSSPRLRIVGETSSWIDGSELDKIGRTTGWTYGRVNGTCQNMNPKDTNITLFCQYRVNRIPGHTQTMSDHGDSGSPVFRWLGSTAILSGVMWGGFDDGSAFVFSPMNQIEQELGSLTTFNFPSPPPPPPCPVGQRCCGAVIDNECVGQCWPEDNPCP